MKLSYLNSIQADSIHFGLRRLREAEVEESYGSFRVRTLYFAIFFFFVERQFDHSHLSSIDGFPDTRAIRQGKPSSHQRHFLHSRSLYVSVDTNTG
jgi:hypothetical protein